MVNSLAITSPVHSLTAAKFDNGTKYHVRSVAHAHSSTHVKPLQLLTYLGHAGQLFFGSQYFCGHLDSGVRPRTAVLCMQYTTVLAVVSTAERQRRFADTHCPSQQQQQQPTPHR